MGGLLWTYTTRNCVHSSPAVADGRVYIGSDDKNIYCLNATTGGLLWTYTTGNCVYSSPAVAGGHIYVGSLDYNVYCLNILTIPAAPLQLKAIAGIGQITLKWSTPFYDGGLGITNYKIYRGISSGTETFFTSNGNILDYSDTDLSNGTIYYYKVSAVNGVGESPLSSEVCASNYRSPKILASCVTPDIGNQYTSFNFSLIYKQSDSNQPSFVNILLNETKFGMNKRDFSDINYVTGMHYQYLTCLPPGTYTYSFECNDSVTYNATEPDLLVVSPATNPVCSWSKIWGGSNEDFGTGVAVDANGSVYCVGNTVNGSWKYLALTKFFSNRTEAWQIVSSSVTDAAGVAVDKDGYIYCVGTSDSEATLVKYASNGTKLWESRAGKKADIWWQKHSSTGTGVAVDNQGGIYCSAHAVDMTWTTWMLVVKFFSNGTKAWDRLVMDCAGGFGIDVDSAGYIYCVGATGLYGLLLVKLSPEGQNIWDDLHGGGFDGQGIAIDANDDVYCIGPKERDSEGDWLNLELKKYYSNGSVAWDVRWEELNATYKTGYGLLSYQDWGVAVDSQGSIYCVASVKDYMGNKANLALIKFFPNGTTSWFTVWGNSYENYGCEVALDSQDAIYCMGLTFINTSNSDFLLLKYIEADPNLPSTTILEPNNGAFFSGGKIWINGTASAGTGHEIQNIIINDTRFTNVTTLIGNDSGKFAFYNSSYISDGILRINVTVINEVDQKGVGLIFFTLDNTPPSAADITSPIGGAFRRGTIWINATATDAVGIKNVTFYRDAGMLLGTSIIAPYSLKWNTSLTSDGNHTLYNRAFDRAGHYLDSSAVTITVDNTPPRIASILDLTPGAYMKVPCFVRVAASDQTSGIKNITLYRDAGVLIGEAGYSMMGRLVIWNSLVLDGMHALYARAFDLAGNYLDSSTVPVIVDNTPPSAAVVISPVVGAYLKGTIWINAIATDAMGIKNVSFYRDDAVLIGTDSTAPYAIQWNTIGLDGVHTLYIRAFDRAGYYDYEIMHAIWIDGTPYPPYICAGNYLDSALISIIVDNTVPTSATVTAPAPGAHVHGTIWINATAIDAMGIKNVTFYRDIGILLGTAITAPYGVQWLTSGCGVHTLYVRAFDNAGNYLNSMSISVTVNTISTIPRNLQATSGTGQMRLTWQAPASDGGSAITHFKIYRGTSSGNETYLITITNGSSFTDTNLLTGRVYYYRVSAVNEVGESSWSAEVSGMVSISWGRNPTFGWTIIILLMVGLVGLSGGILYFNRKTTTTTGKIIGLPKASIVQKESKFWKYISTEVVEDGGLSEMGPESLWNSLRLRLSRLYKSEKWAQALVLLRTLEEIAEFFGDNEKIKELSVKYNEIQGKQHNLSEMGPESLWNSLMLRFNRLYKSGKWAQALVLLRTLNEIAEFLGDDEKIKALSAKHDEIKVKRQQNSYMN